MKLIKICIAVLVCLLFTNVACNREDIMKKFQEQQQEAMDKMLHNPEVTWNAYINFTDKTPEAAEQELEVYKSYHFGTMDALPKNITLSLYSLDMDYASNKLFVDAQKVKLGAPYEKLDAEAEKLVKAMDAFRPISKEVSKHIASKAYLDDNGAWLKQKDAEFIRQAEEYLKALESFRIVHAEANDIHTKELLKELKKAGESREVAAMEVYQSFVDFYKLLDEFDDFNDGFKAKADERINNMKTKIDAFEAENKKFNDDRSAEYEQLSNWSSKVLGEFRALKQSDYTDEMHANLADSYYGTYVNLLNNTTMRLREFKKRM